MSSSEIYMIFLGNPRRCLGSNELPLCFESVERWFPEAKEGMPS